MSLSRKKKKHNKKRNTAFLYEVLVRELTKSILEEDNERKNLVLKICKESFAKNSALYLEKELYKAILETSNFDKSTASKLLEVAKKEHSKINSEKLFLEQSTLISKINKQLNGTPFNIFVPDYKNLASIAQIFSDSLDVKERVLLENEIIELMCKSEEERVDENLKSIDSLTYKTFVQKFNEQYGTSLMEEQKELITKYVMSFVDDGLELKYFLNEEIGRLKEKMQLVSETKEIKTDNYMKEKAGQVKVFLENIRERQIDDEMIGKVLKIQELVAETLE